ncbi:MULTISPECIES: helix-turn-helix transcriptional regulator [Cellulomonas]|uniref:Transcriptional regulator with XRE-family HTH domain n=1 Tax=Cellulomonas iranensis TaxID=76862 RepID=A0ABU0GIN8_9CELL|nr:MULTISPECIES: helix-turn-helix transcriptional regulator [Cellulomonas]MDQ0425188.1 transcriptional regulator with XRE-family HTH domain [Cellulomonas iranensis]TFH71264.1 XRE family transcriptional regulator [Cellulomonas sp. HD19AZ1]
MKVQSSRTRRDLRTLGSHLAAARKVHGLTQQELAERAGVTRATVGNLERGEGGTRIEALLAVARVLGSNEQLVAALDPLSTEFGRLNAARTGLRRVRA